MKCSFCGNKIKFSENSLTFKDGSMCQNCTIKYDLVTERGNFTVDLLNYCQTHTVEEFKQSHGDIPANKQHISNKQNDDSKEFITDSEDEKFKNCDHSVILRRMIPGVGMILAGGVCSLQSFAMFTTGMAYHPNLASGMVGLLFGIYMIVAGIYFVKTAKEWPKDSSETLNQIFFWIMFFVPLFLISTKVFPDFFMYYYVMIACNILAYPFKHSKLRTRLEARLNGYDKDDKSYDNNVEKTSNTSVSSSLDEKADQLAKYKKLLDDNAISQEEYNKMKDKILND